MRLSDRIVSASGAALIAAALSAPASGAPVSVAPGDSGITVPSFTGTGTPTITVLADTGVQSDTIGSTTVDFQEVAVRTSLNAGGVSFAFDMTTSNTPSALSAALPGFAGFMTSVESCDPLALGNALTCGSTTGTVARSGGTGDLITFSGIGTTPVSVPGGGTLGLTNVYALFSNAPSFVDPTIAVDDDGTLFSFRGIAPAASASVPEPGTLALLALGLLGTLVMQRRSPLRAVASRAA